MAGELALRAPRALVVIALLAAGCAQDGEISSGSAKKIAFAQLHAETPEWDLSDVHATAKRDGDVWRVSFETDNPGEIVKSFDIRAKDGVVTGGYAEQ